MPTEPGKKEADRRADTAIALLSDLPFVTDALPGIGGAIKAAPEHFVVEEALPYAPCGEGEHVYVTFRRTGYNTADAARMMQSCLGLAPSDVGWGGRKDKTAVAVQTFSLRCGVSRPLNEIEKALAELPFDILAVDRHLNKIKIGHVAANRFSIIVSQPEADALPCALKIAERLKRTGVPNYFGPQRFGNGMRNIYRGFALFEPQKRRSKDKFMVSVVQAALFNIWLRHRIQDGNFQKLLPGDIAKKTATGGMFVVADLPVESQRFNSGEIIYTGPIYGFKMKMAQDAAGEQEAMLIDKFGLSPENFRRLRSPGSRRQAILSLSDLTVGQVDEGLRFTFTLPAGAYATTVMREFIHS